MATTNRTQTRIRVTRPTLGRTPNDDLLDAFELIGEEIVRRIQNYGEAADTPMTLLDGIQFAARAQRIQGNFTHEPYPWGLYHAMSVLTELMGGPWVEGGRDFEGEFDGADDEDSEGGDDA